MNSNDITHFADIERKLTVDLHGLHTLTGLGNFPFKTLIDTREAYHRGLIQLVVPFDDNGLATFGTSGEKLASNLLSFILIAVGAGNLVLAIYQRQ